MQLTDTRTGMEVLDRSQCLEALGTVPVGRVVMVVGGAPFVAPVNFCVDGESVVFRTADGTKLRAAGRGSVAFEADDYDATTRTGWSVVVHGDAHEIDPPPAGDGPALDPDPWAGGEKPHWVRIHATSVTGRRVR
jgi:nitroimidazol reductase NimA-like FMN-containing flavoprotein (pyridoxamine 5'-phosphate oxidase superfamily)